MTKSDINNILKTIKQMRSIGYTYKDIGLNFGVSPTTVSRWDRGKQLPSLPSVELYKSYKEEYQINTTLYNEIQKLERKRLKRRKRSRTAEGEYITVDNHSVLKVAKQGAWDSQKELLDKMKKTIKQNARLFKLRNDDQFYTGCIIYRRVSSKDKGHSETKEIGIQSRLNTDLWESFRIWQEHFLKFLQGATSGRVLSWVCVEFWIAGRHNGLNLE